MPFKAKYESICPACEETIYPGDQAAIVEIDRGKVTVHAEYCVDIHRGDTGTTPPHNVLPRGLKASDRCDDCFIVHSPGQDGCQ